MTVVLHELLHGLGFTGSGVVDDGSGQPECNGTAGVGCVGLGPDRIPFFYDLWVDSPGHYANMTGSGYTEVGVGFWSGPGGWYATHVFR